ncbi:14966_t:CDS:2 [Acaulospora morrowiae]|uniref:14966_t:CDS:1 n=1 Tax=Acaulospora morrowiae TaxID=94023 RepID=A0A9N9AMJ9_9GLOM|nr:14966_t:CDS:2 [Acaulospora morrowiae]
MYPSRSKVTTACRNCKEKKIKCSGPPVCDRCQEKNRNCDFIPVQKKRGPRPKLKPEIVESPKNRLLGHHPYIELPFSSDNEKSRELYHTNETAHVINVENSIDREIKDNEVKSREDNGISNHLHYPSCDHMIWPFVSHEKNCETIHGLSQVPQLMNNPRETFSISEPRSRTENLTKKTKRSNLSNPKPKLNNKFLNSTIASFNSFSSTPMSSFHTNIINPPILSKIQSEFLIKFYFTRLHEWTPVLNQLVFLAQYYSASSQPSAAVLYAIYSAVVGYIKSHGTEMLGHNIPMNVGLYVEFTKCFLTEEYQNGGGTLLEKFQASCILYWCVWLGYLDKDHRTYLGTGTLSASLLEKTYNVTYEDILRCQHGLDQVYTIHSSTIAEFQILIRSYKIIQSIRNDEKIPMTLVNRKTIPEVCVPGSKQSKKIQLSYVYHDMVSILLYTNISKSAHEELIKHIAINALQLSESEELVPYSCLYFFCLRKTTEFHMMNSKLESVPLCENRPDDDTFDQKRTKLAKGLLANALYILTKHGYNYFLNRISRKSFEFWISFCASENVDLNKNSKLPEERRSLILNLRDINGMIDLFELVDSPNNFSMHYDETSPTRYFDDGQYQTQTLLSPFSYGEVTYPESLMDNNLLLFESMNVHPCQHQLEFCFMDFAISATDNA